MADRLTRRQFMRDSAIAGAAIGAGIGLSGGASAADTSKILNYNPDMEYRRCGRTGMMISAVSLGGHWKRLVKIIGGSEPEGWMTTAIDNPQFQKNRHEVLTRCIDRRFHLLAGFSHLAFIEVVDLAQLVGHAAVGGA